MLRKDCEIAADPNRVLFESPLVSVGDFDCNPAHPRFSNTRPLPDYAFVFPRTAVWIQHEGSRAFVADSNVVPLYNPGRPFRRERISVDGDRTDWFTIAPDVLRDVVRGLDPATADAHGPLFRFDFARVTHQTFVRQREVLLHVRTTTQPVDAWYVEESVITALHETLAGAYARRSDTPALPRHRDLAESAKARLNVMLTEPSGLNELARAVGTSVFHLCRVFRQSTGSTIHRYRNDLRLRQSLALLEDGGDDILVIAIALGYSGHSHFSGAFHKAFGMTPSAFRDASRAERAGVRSEFNRPLIN
jgi:AraC-like DNA-binding protein